MNQFELFTMIFYVLDAEWDETQDRILGDFLSGANPFLFEDLSSADPEIYKQFCEIVTEPITVENSYIIASKYIASLNSNIISKAFKSITEDEWVDSVKEFLSEEHKGETRA
ncbi:MAG: hypothetical protein Q4E28_01340 [Clostridia bacterium]|nr:hypothetical protein [Clostridia bacterium]